MARSVLVCFAVALLLTSCLVDSHRILGIFHFPSRSHHILGKSLMQALAAKGHQVTMLSPFPEKTPVPNYRDIELDGLMKIKDDCMDEMANSSTLGQIYSSIGMVSKISRAIIKHPAVTELLNSNEKFDLVIQFWAFAEALLGIGDHFNAPVIGFSSIGSNIFINYHTGNPTPHSYVPNLMFGFSDRMTFFQRLQNTLLGVVEEIFFYAVAFPFQERLYREVFPNGRPLQELTDDVALYLVNAHYSTETPRPYLPNMITIGGFNVEDNQKIPKDLQEYLDGAKDGFMYFSFGSNVKASHLNSDQKGAIVKTLGKQKLKVLFKFDEDVKDMPTNIRIANWLPQKAIMSHPNLKLFITHGGMGGVSEAIYNGVPFVGIPFFGDQDANVADAVDKGFAEKVAIKDLTEENLSAAVDKVLKNPSYRESIQLRSSIYRHQEMKPIDKAIFWVEHVIKHKGAKHLKSVASELPFYQYYLLDIIAFVSGVSIIMLLITYWTTKRVLRCICSKIFGRKKSKKE